MRDGEIYDIGAHGAMLMDDVRLDAYVRALEATVEPGSVVVDIGTGTGVLALVACALGASRVYALEPAEVIQLAREAARDSGFEDRIEFIQEISHRVELEERGDVLVSDLRGVLPLFQRHLPAIIDARKRFLAPGGTLIPRSDELWVAPVEAASVWTGLTAPWERSPRGIDLSAGRRLVTHRWCQVHAGPDDLLGAPARWAVLDYERREDLDAVGTGEWTLDGNTTAHGLLVWFDARLVGEVAFSNAPGEAEAIYGQAFFPWPEPLELEAGDRLEVSLRADLVGDDYVWRWTSRVFDLDGGPRASFRQASLGGLPLSAGRLRRREVGRVPGLGPDGWVQRRALELMGEGATVGEIAGRLREDFPGEFIDDREALAFAADLSEEYGAGEERR